MARFVLGLWILAALTAPLAAAPGDIVIDPPIAPPGDVAPSVPTNDPVDESEPVVSRDLSLLPDSVAATRDALMAAAATGDVGALQSVLDAQEELPVLSFGGAEDPIDYLRAASNDGEGRELLGIMMELLEAPFAIVGAGTDHETYVWPYFAEISLDNLTPPQLVELYKLISHYDFEEMQHLGGWYFYRVGIAANGDWSYFVAGD